MLSAFPVSARPVSAAPAPGAPGPRPPIFESSGAAAFGTEGRADAYRDQDRQEPDP